ncbi:L-lactate dehydrogenase [Niveomyces insectorum RCEF 264]|uniref:L-lactate dehydrogenase n=1 Tax=Niveomyces insectorum RCEF 264 TaxID=1081102 RepID=A0A167Y115_9HYPO|nr:L-lactate dehydrogenase [Niveomyces insectorum RCEF 264]
MASQTARPHPNPEPVVAPLSACVSLGDIEQVARVRLSPRAASYFHTGAETRASLDRNRRDWGRVAFRPRVLRNVARVSMRTDIMGFDSSLPIFIAPAAAAGLGHEDGELCLARGAARMDVAQCVCTLSSVPPKDVMAGFLADPERRGGALFFQLYIPRVKKRATKLIAMAKAAGFRALVVTVDAPVIGKRDDDDRFKARFGAKPGASSPDEALPTPPLPGSEAETLRASHDPTLEWSDLSWIRACWGDKPIILKGIQTAEDAVEATRHGVDGIYLSNHGGRQLDFAPSAVQTLLEIRRHYPEVFDKTAVYVDGGVTRGTDIVKALCLGARGVGIGRGFLYALSAYGTDGVLKTISSDFE